MHFKRFALAWNLFLVDLSVFVSKFHYGREVDDFEAGWIKERGITVVGVWGPVTWILCRFCERMAVIFGIVTIGTILCLGGHPLFGALLTFLLLLFGWPWYLTGGHALGIWENEEAIRFGVAIYRARILMRHGSRPRVVPVG